MAVFKNVWVAIGTGTTGIGLALVKAFQNRGQPQLMGNPGTGRMPGDVAV
jgi:short-subunit dehydrogenase involved in D-alanine esterification of teichoic acids